MNQDNQAGGVKLEAKALEAGQRAAMVSNGCGATLEGGEHVFCTDARLPDGVRCPDCSCQTDATAAITAFLAAIPAAGAVPIGWKLVPAKVTDQMYVAFREELDDHGHIRRFVEAYAAMLAASPPAPSGGEPEPVAWTDKNGLEFLARGYGIDVSAEAGTTGRTIPLFASPPKPSEAMVEAAAQRAMAAWASTFTKGGGWVPPTWGDDPATDEQWRTIARAALSGGAK